MQCPGCGKTKSASQIAKCDNCGDTRCNDSNGCEGTMGGAKSGGTAGNTCKACHKGKYRKIG